MSRDVEIPDWLSHLPVERGLPIPFVNQHPADEWAMLNAQGVTSHFKMLSTIQTIVCGQNDLCAICGGALDYWKWFVGGEKAYAGRSYTDSPMHERCYRFAVDTCPYIVFRRTKRDEALDVPDWTPPGFEADKPEVWVAGRTRGYELLVRPDVVVYKTRPFAEAERYRYGDDGRIERFDG